MFSLIRTSKDLMLQNQVYYILTGAVRTTPVLAMQILVNVEPVYKSMQRRAVILYHKFTSLPNNTFWRNYNRAKDLKAEDGFLGSEFARPLRLYHETSYFALALMSFCKLFKFACLWVNPLLLQQQN